MQEHQVYDEINDDSDFKRELLIVLIQIRDKLEDLEYLDSIKWKLDAINETLMGK